MPHFLHRTRVKASLEAVDAFHHTPDALRRLTPPLMFMQVQRAEPLAEGSRVEFSLWMGPLPVRWAAVHHNIHQPGGFDDEQASGPFAEWVHRHRFRRLDDQTSEVVDEVQAAFYPGWRGLVGRLMWLGLQLLFAYRGWATRRALEKTPQRRPK